MGATTERGATSLRTRLIAGGALLVALPVLSAVAATWIVGERIASAEVESSLSRSAAAEEHVWRERAGRLLLVCRMISADPAFGGYVAEVAARQDDDRGLGVRSLLDLLDERRSVHGFDVAMVLDERGRVVARTDRPGAEIATLDDPLIERAVRELGEVDGVRAQDGRLLQVAVAPVTSEYLLAGFLVLGLAVDDALAAEIGEVGGTEVVILARGERSTVAASSLDGQTAEAVRRALPDGAARADQAIERIEFRLDGRRMVARLDPLVDGAGATVGAVVALSSLDRQGLAFRRIRSVVLLVGAIALFAGLGLSLVLTRRVTGPLRDLAHAADAAANGNYDQRIVVTGDAEVRTLARSFKRLLGDLRERNEMAEYVREISRHVVEMAPIAGALRPDDDSAADAEAPTVLTDAEPRATGIATDLPRPGATWAERYDILGRLGEGGMGVVYLATDRELGETVALKTLRPDVAGGHDALERLKDELRLARKVTHRNVLRTYDFGEWKGVAYLSMEYVRGITLGDLISRSGRLPESVVGFLARHLCDGLEAAHAQGVLHRDIKPANVIVDPGGRARLMDFGIARPVTATSHRHAALAGTPPYMAPELFDGRPADARTDVYAMGALLAEALAGRRLFDARSLDELLAQKRRDPAPLSRIVPDLSPGFDAVVRRCVEPDPARRVPSAAALRAVLEDLRS